MARGWAGSTRRAALPADWHARRARCWRRAGGQCEHLTNGERCTWRGRLNGDGAQCDHIVRGAGDHDSNLQLLCPTHHGEKTRREAQAARIPTRRPTETHPGIL